jgi:membrane-bound lytic murein transglycosylase B
LDAPADDTIRAAIMTYTGEAISRRLRATLARLFAAALCAIVSLANAADPRVTGYAARADVKVFIADMAKNDGFDAAALTRLFAQVRPQPKVIAAMSRPLVEPPKWYEYVPRFIDPARVDAGVDFWHANDAALARAQAEFGVPAEIIVAIIGIETYYGRNTGSYRVIDALATLAFDYPRRAAYFSAELRQFLLLAREQGVSPLLAKGSFAGASGLPQFMPGSIRNYAVDYDGDGRIDLTGEADDAVGSVGNYLQKFGWRAGQPVMEPARIEGEPADALVRLFDGGITERRGVAGWVKEGVTGFTIPGNLEGDPAGLLMLETPEGPAYWVVFNNWYVLTRYNRSRLYASAVWFLAQALEEARGRDRAARP